MTRLIEIGVSVNSISGVSHVYLYVQPGGCGYIRLLYVQSCICIDLCNKHSSMTSVWVDIICIGPSTYHGDEGQLRHLPYLHTVVLNNIMV